jgi:death on curing protein
MPGYIYPTIAEVQEFHKQLIEQFGGTYGLLDEGRLEAAIFRPQTGYYGSLAEELPP